MDFLIIIFEFSLGGAIWTYFVDVSARANYPVPLNDALLLTEAKQMWQPEPSLCTTGGFPLKGVREEKCKDLNEPGVL